MSHHASVTPAHSVASLRLCTLLEGRHRNRASILTCQAGRCGTCLLPASICLVIQGRHGLGSWQKPADLRSASKRRQGDVCHAQAVTQPDQGLLLQQSCSGQPALGQASASHGCVIRAQSASISRLAQAQQLSPGHHILASVPSA